MDTTITERIHTYIRDEILCGQDEGLTETTPLLALGILDSFALLRLVAHLNQVYSVDITPSQISGRDFATIAAIGQLVASRCGVALDESMMVGHYVPEGPAVFEAPACSQLFVLFTGLGRHLPDGRRAINWPVSSFFSQSGLTDRNVIVLGDPDGQSYRQGVSELLPTPEHIYGWLAGWIAARPHIGEVYCLGISAGGPIAMVAGEQLRADGVWVFGPRPVRRGFTDQAPEQLLRQVEAVTGKSLAQLEAGLTDEDCARIDALCTPAVARQYLDHFTDPGTLIDDAHLAELVDGLSRANGRTRHHVVYCPRDQCDAAVAGALAHCPTVSLVEIEPSDAPPRSWLFARWLPPSGWLMRDHFVADLLLQRQQLRPLLPPFRPALVGASHDGL